MNSHITFHSHNRINYDSTTPANCEISLNKTIKASCAELSFFMAPNIFYNITDKNNFFLINNNELMLENGCYTLNELLTAILALLPIGSNVEYNNVLNKIKFTFLAPTDLEFNAGTLHRTLGFPFGHNGPATEIISTFPPKVYNNCIFVETNLSNNIVRQSGLHSTFCLPINSNKGEMIIFHRNTMFNSRPKVNNNEIKNISVVLRDEYGEVLQGCGDWTMILAVNEKPN